jgi:hypothetical protein
VSDIWCSRATFDATVWLSSSERFALISRQHDLRTVRVEGAAVEAVITGLDDQAALASIFDAAGLA